MMTVSKSYPNFFESFKALGGEYEMSLEPLRNEIDKDKELEGY